MGALQRLHRRQVALVGPGKCWIGNVNRIKKAFRPSLRPQRLQHDCIAVVANAHRWGGKMKPFRQTDGLALAFMNDANCFHNGRQSKLA